MRCGWASAGHDPAIIYDPRAAEFRELEGGDLPLGVAEDVKFVDYTGHPLTPGCVMLIGTDGVWEMHNETQDLYGKDRLREVMRAHHTKSGQGNRRGGSKPISPRTVANRIRSMM